MMLLSTLALHHGYRLKLDNPTCVGLIRVNAKGKMVRVDVPLTDTHGSEMRITLKSLPLRKSLENCADKSLLTLGTNSPGTFERILDNLLRFCNVHNSNAHIQLEFIDTAVFAETCDVYDTLFFNGDASLFFSSSQLITTLTHFLQGKKKGECGLSVAERINRSGNVFRLHQEGRPSQNKMNTVIG